MKHKHHRHRSFRLTPRPTPYPKRVESPFIERDREREEAYLVEGFLQAALIVVLIVSLSAILQIFPH